MREELRKSTQYSDILSAEDKEKETGKNEPTVIQTKCFKNTIISTCVPPLLLFLCPITGVYSIGFYAISLMDSMCIGQPAVVSIAVGLVRTLGSACGSLIVQKCGRRNALILSSTTATVLLFSVSTLLYMQPILPTLVGNWTLVSLLVMVMFFNSVGMSPVPWILCGEWPDTHYKVRGWI